MEIREIVKLEAEIAQQKETIAKDYANKIHEMLTTLNDLNIPFEEYDSGYRLVDVWYSESEKSLCYETEEP